MLEDGYMMVKVQTPCLLTFIKELNDPRYMSVNGIFTCYDKPMEVFDYNALKDDPLIEVDTIGLRVLRRTSLSPSLLRRRAQAPCCRATMLPPSWLASWPRST